jgi:transcriptional antiterminator RfaH
MAHNEEDKKWYAFYCKSRSEKRVLEDLLKEEYIVFLPLRKELRQWSDRKKFVVTPIIPGYIFVHCYQHELYTINKASIHLVAPVKIGDEIAVLRENEIEYLKAIELGKFEISKQNLDKLQKGDSIIITMGPFKGFQATYDHKRNSVMIAVLINSLKQSITVVINAANIEVLS